MCLSGIALDPRLDLDEGVAAVVDIFLDRIRGPADRVAVVPVALAELDSWARSRPGSDSASCEVMVILPTRSARPPLTVKERKKPLRSGDSSALASRTSTSA